MEEKLTHVTYYTCLLHNNIDKLYFDRKYNHSRMAKESFEALHAYQSQHKGDRATLQHTVQSDTSDCV